MEAQIFNSGSGIGVEDVLDMDMLTIWLDRHPATYRAIF